MIASCYDSALDRPRKERLYKERKFRRTGGFLNHQWGTSRVALEEYYSFGEYKLGRRSTIDYRVHLDSLYGVSIDSIFFEFYDDGLVGATVFIDNQHHPSMLDSLDKRIGKYKIAYIKDTMMAYTLDHKWEEKTMWLYYYNMKEQFGELRVTFGKFFQIWLMDQSPAYLKAVLEGLKEHFPIDTTK